MSSTSLDTLFFSSSLIWWTTWPLSSLYGPPFPPVIECRSTESIFFNYYYILCIPSPAVLVPPVPIVKQQLKALKKKMVHYKVIPYVQILSLPPAHVLPPTCGLLVGSVLPCLGQVAFVNPNNRNVRQSRACTCIMREV